MKKLTIRKMREDDTAALSELLADPRVMKYLEPPFSEEKARQFLVSAGLSDPPLIWAAEDEDGFIGYVIDHDYDESSREIGWVLKQEVWGRGYAKELTRQLIARAEREGKDVILECDPEQSATKHIAEAAGFVYEVRRCGCEVYRRKAT